jgi:branched-subunit amino acid ABC-type transport system permease component
MSSFAWGLAGALGALAGVLAAGEAERLLPGQMTSTFLIPGFTAAVLGGLTSMKGAVVGGLLLGVAATLMITMIDAYQLAIPGGSDFAAFLMLLLVLLVRPNGLFGRF